MTITSPSGVRRLGRLLVLVLRRPSYVPPLLVLVVCALLVRGRRLVRSAFPGPGPSSGGRPVGRKGGPAAAADHP